MSRYKFWKDVLKPSLNEENTLSKYFTEMVMSVKDKKNDIKKIQDEFNNASDSEKKEKILDLAGMINMSKSDVEAEARKVNESNVVQGDILQEGFISDLFSWAAESVSSFFGWLFGSWRHLVGFIFAVLWVYVTLGIITIPDIVLKQFLGGLWFMVGGLGGIGIVNPKSDSQIFRK